MRANHRRAVMPQSAPTFQHLRGLVQTASATTHSTVTLPFNAHWFLSRAGVHRCVLVSMYADVRALLIGLVRNFHRPNLQVCAGILP